MPNKINETIESVSAFAPIISRKVSCRKIHPEIKKVVMLEQNIEFLIQASQDIRLPITQYFLEKALESLLEIETN